MNGPKFRLVSDGKRSYFEVCGKSMGKGVSHFLWFMDTIFVTSKCVILIFHKSPLFWWAV